MPSHDASVELVELKTGKKIREAVRDAIRTHGTLTAAGESLGVDRNTMRKWLVRFGLKVRASYDVEPREPAEVAS